MNWYNPGTYAELLKQAKGAAHQNYTPYSQFPMGAAGLFLDERGRHIFACGSKIENVIASLNMCAERVTVFNAVSRGYTKLVALATTCPMLDENDPPDNKMPCGACLQVMMEFSDAQTIILIEGVGTYRLRELLPKAQMLRRV